MNEGIVPSTKEIEQKSMLSDPRQSQKVLEMERFYFCRNIIKSRGEEMGLRGDS